MEENRVSVYGRDFEENEKRAFDWIMVDGQPFMETKDRDGRKVRIPLHKVVAGYKQLTRKLTDKTTI